MYEFGPLDGDLPGWRGRGGAGHGGHGGHGGGGHGGRGGGRRRMLESGDLRLILLRLLEERPRHGYDFIRDIGARTGGHYAPSPGIIYPTLTLLEEIGHVEVQAPAESGDGKRMFAITAAGRAHLDERRGEAEVALGRLEVRSETWTDAGPVWRAMQNLKAVLHGKLQTAPELPLLHAVADLIDEAARKIERLELPAGAAEVSK